MVFFDNCAKIRNPPGHQEPPIIRHQTPHKERKEKKAKANQPSMVRKKARESDVVIWKKKGVKTYDKGI